MEIKHFFSFDRKKTSGFSTLLWARSKAQPVISWRKNIFAVGILFFFVLAIAVWSANRINSWANASIDYQVKLADLSINQLPSWLTPHAQEISPVGLPDKLSIYYRELTQKIANGYLRNPWVEEVKEIRKRYPNQVMVKLSLRQPVVWIKHSQGYFLSDVHCIRLPGSYLHPIQSTNFLPIISGVKKIPDPGDKWQGTAVQVAIQLGEYFNRQGIFQALSLTQIRLQSDTKNGGSKNTNIVFIRENSIPIIWGKSFDSQFPRVSLQQRIKALVDFCRQSQTTKVSQVDIRLGYAIVRTKD